MDDAKNARKRRLSIIKKKRAVKKICQRLPTYGEGTSQSIFEPITIQTSIVCKAKMARLDRRRLMGPPRVSLECNLYSRIHPTPGKASTNQTVPSQSNSGIFVKYFISILKLSY
jgi:hypothetical protein